MTKEIWKDIPGLKGRYSISSHGRVWSEWKKGFILIRCLPTGYRTLELTVNGKRWRRYLHHVVLEVFIGPRPSGYEASHKDGDVSNNRKSNLVWETHRANEKRKEKHGTRVRGERHGRYKHGGYCHAQ